MVYIPPSYRQLIKRGTTKNGSLKRRKDGFEYEYNHSVAFKCTSMLVRQGMPDKDIVKMHMSPKNRGFFWIQAQEDPLSASKEILSKVNRNAKPVLSMRERHKRIKNLLAGGVVLSQNKVIKAVDNAAEWYVFNDVKALCAAGVLGVYKEQHGKRIWYSYFLENESTFDVDAENERQKLCSAIAKKKADYKGKKWRKQWEKNKSIQLDPEKVARDAAYMAKLMLLVCD